MKKIALDLDGVVFDSEMMFDEFFIRQFAKDIIPTEEYIQKYDGIPYRSR